MIIYYAMILVIFGCMQVILRDEADWWLEENKYFMMLVSLIWPVWLVTLAFHVYREKKRRSK